MLVVVVRWRMRIRCFTVHVTGCALVPEAWAQCGISSDGRGSHCRHPLAMSSKASDTGSGSDSDDEGGESSPESTSLAAALGFDEQSEGLLGEMLGQALAEDQEVARSGGSAETAACQGSGGDNGCGGVPMEPKPTEAAPASAPVRSDGVATESAERSEPPEPKPTEVAPAIAPVGRVEPSEPSEPKPTGAAPAIAPAVAPVGIAPPLPPRLSDGAPKPVAAMPDDAHPWRIRREVFEQMFRSTSSKSGPVTLGGGAEGSVVSVLESSTGSIFAVKWYNPRCGGEDEVRTLEKISRTADKSAHRPWPEQVM